MLCPSCGADAGNISRFCPSCGTTLVRAAEADDYIGKIIAKKYRVEQMIGEGGMGRVYKAMQVALDKPVVLKVLRKSLLSDERTVARFQREAKAASRLNHPNSISILDFGQVEDGSLFIAMEFVAGKDLHNILSTEWPLPEARVVRLVSQVLSALADAHTAGVIHRDLKPENIMVEQRRGEPDFVKVLDFGIAKIQDSQGDEGPALTRAGFVCGTPEYMSPEQARGATLDHRSDLYAVGVILYQLMTGLLPFESDSAVGFATKHLTEDPPPPTRRRPDAKISPAMERLILRAMSKSPADRPQTADLFRSELLNLDRASRGPPGGPRRSSVLGPVPRNATPLDQADTRVTRGGGWANEATVRALPSELGRVDASGATVIGRPEEDTKVTPAAASPTGGMLLFKILTVALVVISLSLAGFYVLQLAGGRSDEGYHPPLNAPVPVGTQQRVAPPGSDKPLYEQEIPEDRRDPRLASKLEREGDAAHQRGALDAAAAKYREAFALNPTPELSLKLGEVYHHANNDPEAKGWWSRHLRDHASSRARSYIQESFPGL